MWGRDPESLELGRNRPHPSTPLGSVQSLTRLLTPGRPYRPFQEHISEGHLRASCRAILNLADSANCMMVLHTECMLISPLHCHHIPIIWRATGQECPSLERKPSFFAKPGHSLPLGSATEVVQPLISQCPQNTLTEGTDTFQALYKIPRKPMEAFWHELKKHLPSPPSWRRAKKNAMSRNELKHLYLRCCWRKECLLVPGPAVTCSQMRCCVQIQNHGIPTWWTV
ncbi:uncharacterized protein [Vicugna pacos]|uniref:Uncharacterized protein isoform X3 n=1 Tax=Vicugna pacos TaxID=30538 RepID=A0ABM5C7S0_VICPA